MPSLADNSNTNSNYWNEYIELASDLMPIGLILDELTIVEAFGDTGSLFSVPISYPLELKDVPDCPNKSLLVSALRDQMFANSPFRIRPLEKKGSSGSNLKLAIVDHSAICCPALGHVSTSRNLDGGQFFEFMESPQVGVSSTPTTIVWVTDANGKATMISDDEARFTGDDLEQLIGDGWKNNLHPDDIDQCLATMSLALKNREPFFFLNRKRRFDGEYVWFRTHGVPRFDSQGIFIGHIGFCLDVSRVFDVQGKLTASQQMLKSVLDNSPFLSAYADKNLTYKYVNNRYAQLWNRSRDDIIGRQISEITGPFFQRLVPALNKVLKGETVYHEKRVDLDSGETVWLEITHVPEFDANDQVIGFYCFVSDVTESRQQERVLQLVQNHTPAMIMLLNNDFAIRYANVEFCKTMNFDSTVIIGKSLLQLVGKESYECMQPHLELARSGQKCSFEITLPTSDGRELNVLIKLVPEYDGEGVLAGICGLILDISDLRAAQFELDRSKARFELAVSGSSVGIIEFDVHREDWVFADHIENLLGYERGYFQNSRKRIRELIHPDDRDRNDIANRAMTDGQDSKFELRLKNSDNEYRWFEIFTQQTNDNAAKISRVAGTITDINELKNAQLKSDEQVRRRDEFLAMLSHELRNPMAAIVLSLDCFELDNSPEAVDNLVEIIKRQSTHVAKLLDDLLDVSRITHNRIEYTKQDCDLNNLVQSTVDSFKLELECRNQNVDLRITNRPLVISADDSRIGQTIANLVENAVKYSPNDSTISVLTECQGDEAVILVKDNGIGIDPDVADRIFDMFFQVERSHRSDGGGLGVGLYLVRQIVNAHDGTVTARSQGRGQGAEFEIRIPLVKHDNSTSSSQNKRTRKVAIVEDNDDARSVVAMLLRRKGFDVVEFCDGETAANQIPDLKPDIAIIDVGLPGKNGLQLADELRANSDLKGIRLIALTGYGQSNDRIRISEGGFDFYLVKPINFEILSQTIDSVDAESGRSPLQAS